MQFILLVSLWLPPRSFHYADVLRILWNLKGTMFCGLHFSFRLLLILRAYSNVDWTGDPINRTSTIECYILLDDSLISWRNKKQTVVAWSNTKVEYRALVDAIIELLWLHWLLQNLGVDYSIATLIYYDNQSDIQIVHNDVFHERTKHIETYYHFIHYHLFSDILQLRSISFQD